MKWETIWPNTAKDVVSMVSGLNSLNPDDKMKLTRHNFPGKVSVLLFEDVTKMFELQKQTKKSKRQARPVFTNPFLVRGTLAKLSRYSKAPQDD